MLINNDLFFIFKEYALPLAEYGFHKIFSIGSLCLGFRATAGSELHLTFITRVCVYACTFCRVCFSQNIFLFALSCLVFRVTAGSIGSELHLTFVASVRFLLLMIALSLITLYNRLLHITNKVRSTAHMSCVRDNYFPIAH